MTYKDRWQIGFDHLTEYINKYGNAHVPQGFVSSDGYNLGRWVATQRKNYCNHKLNKDQIQTLLSIGFMFDGHAARNVVREEAWKKGYSHLMDFHKKNGHSNVPITFLSPYDSFPLGKWLRLQMMAYKDGTLSQEHYEMLKALDVKRFCDKDKSRFTTKWNEFFQMLKDYYKSHGNCFVPKSSDNLDLQRLYSWIRRQADLYRKGRLCTKQIDMLNSVGLFDSSKRDAIWETGFNYYVEYVLNKGLKNITYDYVCPDNYKLGQWIHHQVKAIKNGTIPENRLRRLKEIAFTEMWQPPLSLEQAWNNGYKHLLGFYNRFGLKQVPGRYVCSDGYWLGGWVSKQRKKIRDKSMTTEHLVKLYRINFPVTPYVVEPVDPNWEIGFNHLLDYYEQHGHAYVSRTYKCPDGYDLYNWCDCQRKKAKCNKLTNEQNLKLASIGFYKTARTIMWEKGYSHLAAFYKEHKDTKVVNTYISPDGFPLGSWVHVQLQSYSLGRLSEQRINKLLSLGFEFKPIHTRSKKPWESGINNLCLFYDTYKNYHIPQKYRSPDGFYLGHWVVRIRRDYNRLSLDKLIELESIGFLSKVLKRKEGRRRNGLYGF